MIYISGKMTGVKDFNYPEFNRVAKKLRDLGHEVFNPAEIKINPKITHPQAIWNAYMDRCIPAIEKCSSIYLLKGWENSKGAKLELKKAIELGLLIVLKDDIG